MKFAARDKEFSHSGGNMSSELYFREVIYMTEKKNSDSFISDSGIFVSNKTKQAKTFVLICNVLTLILAVLGFITFIIGNF